MMNTGTVAALGWRGRSWAYTGQPGTRERWNQVTIGPITRGWYMVEVVTVSLLILQKTFSVKSHDIQLAFSFTHCLLLDHQAVALTMHNQHLFDGSSCSMWCIFGLYYIFHITTKNWDKERLVDLKNYRADIYFIEVFGGLLALFSWSWLSISTR